MDISPNIISKLFDYQIPHLQALIKSISKNGIAIDGSDTGTGKTYTAMALCKHLNLRPLIISPKSVIQNWESIANLFDVEVLSIINYETIKNGKQYSDFTNETREDCPFINIVREAQKDGIGNIVYNKSGEPKCIIKKITWNLPDNSLIIFDEAHKGKSGIANRKISANSKLLASMKPYLDKARKVGGLFLSATITDNSMNFDVILYLLGFYRPYVKKSYTRYIASLGEEVMSKLNKKIFPKYGSRMDIKEIPEFFKINDTAAQIYPVDKKIAQAIEEQHAQIAEALERIRMLGDSNGLGYIIRCWQKIELLKVPTVADLAEQYYNEHKSVVIFVNYNETKKSITEKLLEKGFSLDIIDYINGDQNMVERAEVVKKFANDEIRILICNIKAGGVGLSLHDINGNFPRVSLIFPTWSAIDMIQALGRIHRSGAKTDATQRIIYCKSNVGKGEYSVEEYICSNVNKKIHDIESLNNQDLSGFKL